VNEQRKEDLWMKAGFRGLKGGLLERSRKAKRRSFGKAESLFNETVCNSSPDKPLTAQRVSDTTCGVGEERDCRDVVVDLFNLTIVM